MIIYIKPKNKDNIILIINLFCPLTLKILLEFKFNIESKILYIQGLLNIIFL